MVFSCELEVQSQFVAMGQLITTRVSPFPRNTGPRPPRRNYCDYATGLSLRCPRRLASSTPLSTNSHLYSAWILDTYLRRVTRNFLGQGQGNDQAQGRFSLSSFVDITLRSYVGYNEPGIHRCKGRAGSCCYHAGNPNYSNTYDFIHFHRLDIEPFVSPALQGRLESHGPISSEIPIDPVLQQQSAHAT
jgi:hypothetical protein